jgi:hypothetical protein
MSERIRINEPKMPDPLHGVTAPEYLDELRIGEKAFTVFPPMYVDIPQKLIDAVISVVESVTRKANISDTPDFIRVDLAPTKQGEMRLLEINAQIPGGMEFNKNALEAYGEERSAEHIIDATESMLGTSPTYIISAENGRVTAIGHAQAAIAKTLWPTFTAIPGDMASIEEVFRKGADFNRALRFMVDSEFHGRILDAAHKEKTDIFKVLTESVINKPYTGLIGEKDRLEHIDSPLMPDTKAMVLEAGEYIVPSGRVWKAAIGLGGKDVFFPGDTVAITSEQAGVGGVRFVDQEFIDIATFDYKGIRYKYGLDMYLMRDKNTRRYKVFFMTRTCRDDIPGGKLNLSSGGGLIPVVANIISDHAKTSQSRIE